MTVHRQELEQLLDKGPDFGPNDYDEIAHREWCARVAGLAALVTAPHEHHWVYAGLTLAHGGSGQVARQRCEDYPGTSGCGAERLVT